MITTLLALAVTGAAYDIDWQADGLHLTGVVDTTTDTLTWDWLPDDLGSLEWPAVTMGERIPRPDIHYEIIPYDVPDDWSGVLDEWGFLSDAARAVSPGFTNPGLGCSLDRGYCRDQGAFCDHQLMHFSRGPVKLTIANIKGALSARSPALVDLQPVSPTRAVGDVNWDGLFDSGDLVTVFTLGKFETGQPAIWVEGDWDQNGLFNSSDMVAAFVGGDYERPVTAVVPEPSAVVLFLIGLAVMRKRR